MNPPASPTSPARQSRAVRNDERILDAAVRIAATHGWAALVPSRVAADSGLARSTVQERFRDRASLGAALWERRCAKPIERGLAGMVAAGVPSGRRAPQRADVAESLSRLCQPDPELLAGTELIVAAHYDAATAAAVRTSLGAVVTGWRTDGRAEDRGRGGYLAMIGLGLLLAARRTGAETLDWDHVAGAIAEAAAEDRQAVTLPDVTAPHLLGDIDLAPGDPALDALLTAALREIGSRGFEGASIDGIARAAQRTKGLVFSRFPTKLDLFIEATRRQQTLAFAANEEFLREVTARHGRGEAEAVALRQIQHPRLAYARSIALEQLRLSWHYRELKAAQEADLDAVVASFASEDPVRYGESPALVHLAYAVGLGAAALPLLHPGADALAYDVMTVPLADRGI